MPSKSSAVKVLRVTRRLHRQTGVLLFVFFFIIAITGLLLGWKKNSGGYLLAATKKGASADAADWLPSDSLINIAIHYLQDSISVNLSPEIDRLDYRPSKGIVKVLFTQHYDAVQIDCSTGQVLSHDVRRSDWVEHVHDGTIVDNWLGLSNGAFKLIYTSIMGIALLIFTLTGFWLWYGPKRLRKMKTEGRGV